MKTDVLITKAEETLKEPLEKFFTSIYPEDQLISHGIEHHRRVWDYAKELLGHVYEQDQLPDQLFVSKLLIACFLHDVGMSVEKGERHGGHSSSICSEFLKQNSLHASDYQDVLEAIKHHDDKDYKATPVENKILYILTAADDLDAFGTDGAERYLEIYRLRGIQEDKINEKIIANALNRFRNFELNYSMFPDLISKHKRRYEALVCYLNNNPT